MKPENKRKEIEKYKIDEGYEEILDVVIDSKGNKNKIVACTVACKQENKNMIDIFDIYDR